MTGNSPPRRGTSGQIGRAMYQGYYGSPPERGTPEPAQPPAASPADPAMPTAELPPTIVTAEAPRALQRQRQAPRQRQQPTERWDENRVYETAARNIREGTVQVAGVGETVGLGRDTTVQGQRNHRAPHRTPTV